MFSGKVIEHFSSCCQHVEKYHSEDQGVDESMVSEWILGELAVGVDWIQLAGSCGDGNEPSASGATELVSCHVVVVVSKDLTNLFPALSFVQVETHVRYTVRATHALIMTVADAAVMSSAVRR
jgi:hypothetical protein